MAVLRASGRADFTFEVGALDPDALRVLRFRGNEGLSLPYRFELDLVSPDGEVDFDAVVGEKAKFIWKTPDGERFVHGIVSQFEQTGRGRALTHYTLRLVPKVWSLTLRRRSRIFQNLATPDLLKKVLQDGAMVADEFRLSLKRSYKPRKYCVQYRETDFDFLSRLMEEEGIFYFFEHTEDGHVLVIGDDPAVHVPIEGTPQVPMRQGESEMLGEERITSFHYVRAMRMGAVMLRDFDFKKPALDLKVEKQAEVETQFEYYDYPGEYPDTVLGGELARIRLEEQRTRKSVGEGESDCRRLVSGCRFTLEGHPRPDFDQEYLLVGVEHWGEQPQAAEEDLSGTGEQPTTYSNRFECIPSTIPFRPRRITPHPRVEGPQTAVVTGPSGEEIHTDEHGRVKVHFHWDREGGLNDKSSCWIRVSQSWAGPGWGGMLIPRIGQEVIVEFLEGDPDCPLITGRVYNGTNPPPYGLPGEKTKSTLKSDSSPGGGGSNELRYEDAKGSEEIYLHGQKDWNIVIENDKTQQIGHDESLHVKNDRDKTVDNNQSETIGNNKTITVGSNHTESVGASMTINVGTNLTETVALNYAETVGAAMELTIGGVFAETVGAQKTETVGANKDESVGGDKSESVGGSKTEEVSGKKTETVAKEYSVKAKKVSIEADDEIALRTGDATILMKKSGDISIKGKKISVTGSGDIVLKGKKILEN